MGAVLSPCLSNIYLDRLDKFVETALMPGYTRGVLRKPNPEHNRVRSAHHRARKRGDHATVRALGKQQRSLPTGDPCDPGYRRLRYVRYADDILLGFAGPKDEAEEIKRRLAQFLQDDLKLELSETKTLITHARTSAARFLGYEITTQHANQIITDGRRKANSSIRLRVPGDVIKAKCSRYMSRGKPERRPELLNDEDHSIISRYGAEYRGIVQYYLLAGDVHRLDRLHWVMVTSLLKTLAAKYDSSVSRMARKYGATINTPHGPRRCIQVSVDRGEGRKLLVATFGGIPLRRQKNAILRDREPVPTTTRRTELVHRLLAGRCELCGKTDQVRVHQIRKLADLDRLGQPQPEWAQIMATRRRKTLVVCETCHAGIHGRPTASNTE
ncbi:MAG: group II intron reverse transcriptase/maturase [Solirubrobacteraceae bacterium]